MRARREGGRARRAARSGQHDRLPHRPPLCAEIISFPSLSLSRVRRLAAAAQLTPLQTARAKGAAENVEKGQQREGTLCIAFFSSREPRGSCVVRLTHAHTRTHKHTHCHTRALFALFLSLPPSLSLSPFIAFASSAYLWEVRAALCVPLHGDARLVGVLFALGALGGRHGGEQSSKREEKRKKLREGKKLRGCICVCGQLWLAGPSRQRWSALWSCAAKQHTKSAASAALRQKSSEKEQKRGSECKTEQLRRSRSHPELSTIAL